VWEHLTSFERFGEWNPFVLRMEGELAVGSTLDGTLRLFGPVTMPLAPTITEIEAPTELHRVATIASASVFSVDHYFHIEDRGTGSRVTIAEDWSGFLAPIIGALGMWPLVRRGNREMLQALKRRCHEE
jgi:hypothetical protein